MNKRFSRCYAFVDIVSDKTSYIAKNKTLAIECFQNKSQGKLRLNETRCRPYLETQKIYLCLNNNKNGFSL